MKQNYLRTIIQLALAEDIGQGDITTDNLIPVHLKTKARLIAKSSGVICGLAVAQAVFKELHSKIIFKNLVQEGQKVTKGQSIAEMQGSARALLTGERVALNFLSHLSGIATTTREYVDAIKPYKTMILDTRKTIPLLRQLERYAVFCGGGQNHRFNLNDMAMIKDNHRRLVQDQSLKNVVDDFKKKLKLKVEVEVDSWEEYTQVLSSRADIILLDNMTSKQIAKAVALRNKLKSKILLEASGGITLKTIKQYAATGVDRISIGALTHSPRSLDISLDFI